MAPRPISVQQLTLLIKDKLEGSLSGLWVQGEISNFTDHSSGHIYFTLKDDKSQIKCTLWKWQRGILRFRPEDGLQVVVRGDIRVYEKGGVYQINITAIDPAGVGALQLAFEQLKLKLAAEGLFDPALKKEIPAYPSVVGVVTSETGAALRDIIQIIRRRNKTVRIILNPAKVQGEGAAEDVARAIAEFNESGLVDVLIVGRGGGSLEDLQAFNEEVVARAIAASDIPIISAVGHETDFTIADFTADLRAPTPSAAAELAVPSLDDLVVRVKTCADTLAYHLKSTVDRIRERLNRLAGSYVFKRPQSMIENFYQRLDDLLRIFEPNLGRLLDASRGRLKSAAERLELLSPLATLARGYSITFKAGKVVTDTGAFQEGDEMETMLSTGRIQSRVIAKTPLK